MSPFGSYSQFLKTIPLFGRLFAGERKGFATAMFAVKGAIEDPEVTYLPMKSFATGLTASPSWRSMCLKNTVMLPIDLVTPDENKTVSKGLHSSCGSLTAGGSLTLRGPHATFRHKCSQIATRVDANE